MGYRAKIKAKFWHSYHELSVFHIIAGDMDGTGSTCMPYLYEGGGNQLSGEVDPFSDIPEPYRLTVCYLKHINEASLGPGNFTKRICERLFSELYGPDNLRLQYSYHGGGKLSKKRLDPERVVYLIRYATYFYPELRDELRWKDAIAKINESLRRPVKNKADSTPQ